MDHLVEDIMRFNKEASSPTSKTDFFLESYLKDELLKPLLEICLVCQVNLVSGIHSHHRLQKPWWPAYYWVFQGNSNTGLIWINYPSSPWREATRGTRWGVPLCSCKVTGCYDSVLVCLIPIPRGTNIVTIPWLRSCCWLVLTSQGYIDSLNNFAKATSDTILKTYRYHSLTSGKRLCSSHLLLGINCPSYRDHTWIHSREPGPCCGYHKMSLYEQN